MRLLADNEGGPCFLLSNGARSNDAYNIKRALAALQLDRHAANTRQCLSLILAFFAIYHSLSLKAFKQA